MSDRNPLYLGFDLSTQAIKGVAIDSTLTVRYSQVYEFDTECPQYGIKKGVLVNEAENEVFAPVKMWLEGLDTVLTRLKAEGLDFTRVKGVSGAGMQHGSVYWSNDGVQTLGKLDAEKDLGEQMDQAFSWPYSPNWQDASTQSQCDEFDKALGSEDELARVTGSKAHHVSQSLTNISMKRLTEQAIHGATNSTISSKASRGVRQDCSNITRLFFFGFCILGQSRWHRYR